MALHPASVEEGERVALVLFHNSDARIYKGHITGHTVQGDAVIVVNVEGRPTRWHCSYSDQGTIWAKGWSNPDVLLAAFLLDRSARTLA